MQVIISDTRLKRTVLQANGGILDVEEIQDALVADLVPRNQAYETPSVRVPGVNLELLDGGSGASDAITKGGVLQMRRRAWRDRAEEDVARLLGGGRGGARLFLPRQYSSPVAAFPLF